jgi:methyl-accepting chemotaxis protein
VTAKASNRDALISAGAIGAVAAVADLVAGAVELPSPITVLSVLVVTALAAAMLTGAVRVGGTRLHELGARLRRGPAEAGEGAERAAPPASADQMGALVGQVVAETDAMTSSIEQLSAEANSIAFNVMMQVGASETARSSMDEMSSNIGRVAVLAEETEQRSQRVSELATEGETRAQSAVADMDRLADSFRAIEERVKPLLLHADEIGAAAELIHRIASQTKLLSLNATIEAVRAGERGSGFAVVAEEVRKLADASSTASLQITTAVSAIQSGTAAVAEGNDSAADAVHTGLDHVTRTFELLGPIRREADDTLSGSREVAAAVSAEASLTSEAVEAMGQVLEMSGQTETVANQALETSSAMSRATDAILTAIAPWLPSHGETAGQAEGDETSADNAAVSATPGSSGF